jgi:hypothetical protein
VSLVSPGAELTPIYEQAANYSGWAGRPPPPVDSAEKVAKVVLARLDRPRKRTQVGLANNLMRFGFTVLPGVYDALVGPLFRFAATDLTRPQPPVAGNVLHPVPERHRVVGHQAGAAVGIGRNLLAGARRKLPGGAS